MKYKINIISTLPKVYKLIFYHFLSMNEFKKRLKNFQKLKNKFSIISIFYFDFLIITFKGFFLGFLFRGDFLFSIF